MINDNEKIKTKSRAPKRFDVTLSLARYFHPIPQFSTFDSIVGVHMSFFLLLEIPAFPHSSSNIRCDFIVFDNT